MDDAEPWMSTADVVTYTGYSEVTVTRAASRGELAGHRINPGRGAWKYKRHDVDAWLRRENRKPRLANTAAERIRGAA